MIETLKEKLKGDNVLSKFERDAIIYIITEYERIHIQKGSNVTIEMSHDMAKKITPLMFKSDGSYKM